MVWSGLERVLASRAFRSSRRSHRFLKFVVTQGLEGMRTDLN